MKRFYLFFILLSAIFIVISGCDSDDDGDTYISNSESNEEHHDKTIPRNIQASDGNGIQNAAYFSHLISYNNKFVAFVTTQGNNNGAYQLYTVTAWPKIDKPTNYLIGGQGEATGVIRQFRISPNSKWVVWIDNDEWDSNNPVNTGWTLRSQKVDSNTGAPDGAPIVLRHFSLLPGGTPAWSPEDFRISPDSDWVAYRYDTTTDGGFELYCIPIDGATADHPDVRVHAAVTIGRHVELDYNFTKNSDWLVFVSDNLSTLAGEYGLFSYRVHSETSEAWTELDLHIPLSPFTGVSRFKTTSNSSRVVYTGDFEDQVNHQLWSVRVDPDDVADHPPVQLNPTLTVANTHVQNDFEIASHDRVVFRADEPIDNQFGLYSARIDHDGSADPWADYTIEPGVTAVLGVNIPTLGGTLGLPMAQVAFRLTKDKHHVVYIANLDAARPNVFDIFSHDVDPDDDDRAQLTPPMPDTTNPAQSLGVRDFQVGDHDYVVLIGSLYQDPLNVANTTIYELYRARVGVDYTDIDENTAATYREAFLLHTPLTLTNNGCYVSNVHLLGDVASFWGPLADPSQLVFNGYYVEIDGHIGPDAVEHQVTDFDLNTSVPEVNIDSQPRTLEKYLFADTNYANTVFARYTLDCYPPSGDGGKYYGTYTGDQIAVVGGPYYLYIGYGPKGESAPLMNDWTIKILALLTFMGIALLVSRKVCRA